MWIALRDKCLWDEAAPQVWETPVCLWGRGLLYQSLSFMMRPTWHSHTHVHTLMLMERSAMEPTGILNGMWENWNKMLRGDEVIMSGWKKWGEKGREAPERITTLSNQMTDRQQRNAEAWLASSVLSIYTHPLVCPLSPGNLSLSRVGENATSNCRKKKLLQIRDESGVISPDSVCVCFYVYVYVCLRWSGLQWPMRSDRKTGNRDQSQEHRYKHTCIHIKGDEYTHAQTHQLVSHWHCAHFSCGRDIYWKSSKSNNVPQQEQYILMV